MSSHGQIFFILIQNEEVEFFNHKFSCWFKISLGSLIGFNDKQSDRLNRFGGDTRQPTSWSIARR